MLVSRGRTKRPRDLYYSWVLVFGHACVGEVGDCETATLVVVESVSEIPLWCDWVPEPWPVIRVGDSAWWVV